MKTTFELNETNFENEVLKSVQPVLVDFWAPWCGPCKMITPVLDEIAAEKADSVKIGKVNVDENPALAQRYQIKSIPTLLYFSAGELRDRGVGAASKKTIVQKLDGLGATAGIERIP